MFVANFVADSETLDTSSKNLDRKKGNMVRSDGDDNYRAWKKRMESLHYTFSEEVDFLLQQVDQFDHLFKVTETHPPLLKFLLGKQISMETFVILNQILNFIPQFDKKIVETIVWSDVRRTVMKYTPFVSVDTVKYKGTLKEKVLDHQCLSLNQK